MKNRFSSRKPLSLPADGGFTLMELMTVIAILGILSAFAVPNFIAWKHRSAVRGAAYQVKSILEQAKMAAARHRETVRIDVLDHEITAYIEKAANPDYTPGEDVFIAHASFDAVSLSKNNAISFNSRGISPSATLSITNRNIESRVIVNKMGRVRIE